MATHYDLIVIGSGPAGEKGAAQAAYFGKRVALIERANLGGTGINTGTVPSKTLRETALYFSGLRQRGLYGIDYSLREGLTVKDFLHREHQVVEHERDLVRRNLERHKVDVIWGEAYLKTPNLVGVRTPAGGGSEIEGDIILIATGSSPHHPPEVPFDNQLIYDSDSILGMDHIPRTMTVIGGGVIGCEYASIFAALGVQVTLVESRDRLLPFADHEIANALRARLEKLDLRFIFNERVVRVDPHPHEQHTHIYLRGGERLECEISLFAAGRKSNTQALGLEAIGLQLGERGMILVNDKYQTTIPNIYAAGDVIGFPALASTSMEQARVAMVHAFSLHYKESLSPTLPLAVYTIPEIAMVGLSEGDCQQKDIPYLVGRSYYEKSPRGQIIGDEHGMLKLIFAPEDKRLLGVHQIGELASELIHIGAQVVSDGGTIDTFIRAVYNYPTLADLYKYAAYDGLGQWEAWKAARKAVPS